VRGGGGVTRQKTDLVENLAGKVAQHLLRPSSNITTDPAGMNAVKAGIDSLQKTTAPGVLMVADRPTCAGGSVQTGKIKHALQLFERVAVG
jgi:hypothetical protein